MPKHLVEVSQPQAIAIKSIGHSIRTLGSHFATRAHWRHHEGLSTGSIIVDADDPAAAILVVPPAMRNAARVTPATDLVQDREPAPSSGCRTATFQFAA